MAPTQMPRFTFNTQLNEEGHKLRLRLQRRLGVKGPALVMAALRALEAQLAETREASPAA